MLFVTNINIRYIPYTNILILSIYQIVEIFQDLRGEKTQWRREDYIWLHLMSCTLQRVHLFSWIISEVSHASQVSLKRWLLPSNLSSISTACSCWDFICCPLLLENGITGLYPVAGEHPHLHSLLFYLLRCPARLLEFYCDEKNSSLVSLVQSQQIKQLILLDLTYY